MKDGINMDMELERGKVEKYDKNVILRQAGLKVLKSKKVWQVRPLIYIMYPGSKRPPTR